MTATRTPLTDKQQRVYDYCQRYFLRNDALPPSRTIQTKFGWASQSAAVAHLRAIRRKGWMERNEHGKLRFVREDAEVCQPSD